MAGREDPPDAEQRAAARTLAWILVVGVVALAALPFAYRLL